MSVIFKTLKKLNTESSDKENSNNKLVRRRRIYFFNNALYSPPVVLFVLLILTVIGGFILGVMLKITHLYFKLVKSASQDRDEEEYLESLRQQESDRM